MSRVLDVLLPSLSTKTRTFRDVLEEDIIIMRTPRFGLERVVGSVIRDVKIGFSCHLISGRKIFCHLIHEIREKKPNEIMSNFPPTPCSRAAVGFLTRKKTICGISNEWARKSLCRERSE